MIINILAGGPVRYIPDLSKYHTNESYWIGVDRGVYELLKRNIIPNKGFGDFDSISEQELIWMKEQMNDMEIYPSEKDDTDLELALDWAVSKNPEKIQLFGATGGRIDHLLGNIQLLLKGLEHNIEIEMIDNQNTVVVKKPGVYQIQQDLEHQYVSFLAVTKKVNNITLEGFKYPLYQHDLSIGKTLCISNELINKIGTFSFTEGILIMVRSKD